MTYVLHIGHRAFSSWSLRAWLTLQGLGVPHRVVEVGLYSGTLAADLAALAPARTVPVLVTPEGDVLSDSLAIAETLAERHPDAGLWPRDRAARALARSMVAEMHAGFQALRGACPMVLVHAWDGFRPDAAVRADLARVEALWSLARARHGAAGPWLFGAWSLADAYYAPVAARIAGYRLAVGAEAADYVARHLAHPAFRAWRRAGLTGLPDPLPYRRDLPPAPWPGPD